METILTHSLRVRLLSALVLMPAVLFALIYGNVPFWAMVIVAYGLSLYEWVQLARRSSTPWRDCAMGIVYITACFASFLILREYTADGMWAALALILSVWAVDSGAYFSGKMIGGPKMAPILSPKKTWAGLAGGVVCSAAAMATFQLIHPFLGLPAAFALGALIGVAGQIGDIMISWLKRRVGAKDTGHLIPGHGGLLDRIDSLLLAAPVTLVFICLVTP